MWRPVSNFVHGPDTGDDKRRPYQCVPHEPGTRRTGLVGMRTRPFYGTSDDGSAATGGGCSMNGRRGWAGGGTGAQRQRSAGPALGRYDVLIAGQAVARALTLVTHNLREFGRVPGLALEDWLE